MNDAKGGYSNKLKGTLFGLLCEREKDGQWERFLDSIILELSGYPESSRTINYYTLYYKISSLRYLRFVHFRATIFDCMNLIPEVVDEVL